MSNIKTENKREYRRPVLTSLLKALPHGVKSFTVEKGESSTELVVKLKLN